MYRDADIWILDEPTSSLAPEAEAAIFAELKENLKGRIGIVISHRFSTVRIAARIAVVDEGKITELGTHDELLAQGGRYARLFEQQTTKNQKQHTQQTKKTNNTKPKTGRCATAAPYIARSAG